MLSVCQADRNDLQPCLKPGCSMRTHQRCCCMGVADGRCAAANLQATQSQLQVHLVACAASASAAAPWLHASEHTNARALTWPLCMQAFAAITDQIRGDLYLHPHFRYYVREVRTVAYAQVCSGRHLPQPFGLAALANVALSARFKLVLADPGTLSHTPSLLTSSGAC